MRKLVRMNDVETNASKVGTTADEALSEVDLGTALPKPKLVSFQTVRLSNLNMFDTRMLPRVPTVQ